HSVVVTVDCPAARLSKGADGLCRGETASERVQVGDGAGTAAPEQGMKSPAACWGTPADLRPTDDTLRLGGAVTNWIQVYRRGGAPAPQQRMILIACLGATSPADLMGAIRARRLRFIIQPSGMEVHHTRGASVPEQRVIVPSGSCRSAPADLIQDAC